LYLNDPLSNKSPYVEDKIAIIKLSKSIPIINSFPIKMTVKYISCDLKPSYPNTPSAKSKVVVNDWNRVPK